MNAADALLLFTAITALATTLALVQRHHETPRPIWRPSIDPDSIQRESSTSDMWRRVIRLTNVGDGSALDCEFRASGKDVRLRGSKNNRLAPVAVLKSGESIELHLWVPGIEPLEDGKTRYRTGADVFLAVKWREAPFRWLVIGPKGWPMRDIMTAELNGTPLPRMRKRISRRTLAARSK